MSHQTQLKRLCGGVLCLTSSKYGGIDVVIGARTIENVVQFIVRCKNNKKINDNLLRKK